MSQPEPIKRTPDATPQTPRPLAPTPTPSRPHDPTFAAGAARLAVDNQPGYDEQVRQRSPDGLDTGRLTIAPNGAQTEIFLVNLVVGDLVREVADSENRVGQLESEIAAWVAADDRALAGSAGFTDALDVAVRAERRKDLIESMLSVIDLTKSLTRLASMDGLPSMGTMTDLATATDVTKGAGSAKKVAKGLTGEHRPSPALAALAKLGQQVDGIAEGLDERHAKDVRISLEALNEKLAWARRAMTLSTQAIVNLGNVAPTSAVLPDARQSLSNAIQRMRQIEARLRVAQSHLRAIARSRPATLAPGGPVRALVDAAREQPESTTGLIVVQNTHLDVTIDASGGVIDERPQTVSFHIRANDVQGRRRMEALGIVPGEDVGALGEAALRPVLGLPREELSDVTLKTASPHGPTKTIPAAEWLHDRDGACASFASLARKVDDYEAKSSVRHAR